MSESKRLKILIITDNLPYPLSTGGRICLYNFVDYLRKYHDFTIFVPSYSFETANQKQILSKKWEDVAIEYVDLTGLKEENSIKKIIVRGLNFIKRKIDAFSNHIEFKADENYKNKLDFTFPFKPKSQLFLERLHQITTTTNFDIIQIQYTSYLNLISILPEKPVKIFEQIESQFDVIKDFTTIKKIAKIYSNYLVKNSIFLENSYTNKYDAVFTLNNKDENYFKTTTSFPRIFTSPFGVLDKDISEISNFNFVPKKIVFSGNESHYPNFDALEWYLINIHKTIIKKHNINIHITGNWSVGAKKHLKKISPEIIFEGFVDNYISFLKESIVIVPIRIGGGGLRTKILYAMANGVPVVSTSVGAFGIEGEHNEHFLIADTPEEFSKAIMNLMVNPTIIETITKKAYSLIMEKYSQTATSELRNMFYLELTKNRTKL